MDVATPWGQGEKPRFSSRRAFLDTRLKYKGESNRRWIDIFAILPQSLLLLYFFVNPTSNNPSLHFLYLLIVCFLAFHALHHVAASRRLTVPIRLSVLNMVIVTLFAVQQFAFSSVSFDPRSLYYWVCSYYVYYRASFYFLFFLWVMRRGKVHSAEKYTVIACSVFVFKYVFDLFMLRMTSLSGITSGFHNSFLALMAMVVLFKLSDYMYKHRMPLKKEIAFIALSIVLFGFPFFGVLRAASVIIVFLTVLMSVMYGVRLSKYLKGLMFVAIALTMYLTVGGKVTLAFRDNPYGYNSPREVLQGATRIDEGTGAQRIDWWKVSALPILKANPILGSSFASVFSVSTSGGEVTGIGMYHNYWASMGVDGGLLLALPHTILLLYPVVVGFGLVFVKRDKRPIPYILWILAVLLTNVSNAWGHSTFHGDFEFVVFGTAAAKIMLYKLEGRYT